MNISMYGYHVQISGYFVYSFMYTRILFVVVTGIIFKKIVSIFNIDRCILAFRIIWWRITMYVSWWLVWKVVEQSTLVGCPSNSKIWQLFQIWAICDQMSLILAQQHLPNIAHIWILKSNNYLQNIALRRRILRAYYHSRIYDKILVLMSAQVLPPRFPPLSPCTDIKHKSQWNAIS
jgi:hypothetical protein